MIDGAASLLEGLTDAQRRAVVTDASPVCVLAAAGAGKTRVLTRRIAYRVAAGTADPSRVLALTFTRRAASEMTNRLRAAGMREQVGAGTFHAVAAAQLRRWWADRGQPPPSLLDRKSRILAPLIAARPGLRGLSVSDVAGQIEWAKARLVDPGRLGAAAIAARRTLPAAADDLDAVFARYEHEKTRRGLVDFDDLLARCADAIETDPVFAAAQRWRWRHVFVDEFQDVNPLQHRLLMAWLGRSEDLCVVGDPNQAIYGWNGADPALLASLPAQWPGAEIVHLDANHRCSPQIVAAASAVLGASGAQLTSTRPDGPAVTVRSWPNQSAEAKGIAAALRRAHDDGAPWTSMAVLMRTNAQAVTIADSCRALGIPVRTPGRAALLAQPAVRAALADLRPRRAAPVRMAAADLAEVAARSLAPAVSTPAPTPGAATATGADAGRDDDAAALEALIELARHAERLEATMTIGAWIDDWLPVTLGRDGDDGSTDAVTVCSFHRAKGLEWRSVWICGLEAGLVPIGHATTPSAVAEEQRLLYVALTRAETSLHCSWAEHRTFGANAVRREPSPWLSLIEAVPDDGEDAAAQEISIDEWRRRLDDQRERLRATPPRTAGGRRHRSSSGVPAGWPSPDPEVLEALLAWRTGTSRASGVPAHVVLHDTVLTALASFRPVDEAGLLAIPGLGPIKASRFGSKLLSIVADRAVSA